ncbi:MAG: bifunctional riboflavin kinase/FAD synthetase [Bacteroidia bacterium]
MKIHYQHFDGPKPQHAVVTTGTFDGVHLGHQTIIKRLVDEARAINGESVVVTFDPHPRQVLFPNDHGLKLLQTLDEKAKSLDVLGVHHLLVLPFSRSFADWDYETYVRRVLIDELHTHKLIIGYDHQFGKNREGTIENLKRQALIYGFEIEEIPAKDIDQVHISSTQVRKALTLGDIATANRYLGYSYSLSGMVVRGHQNGRSIGFPTANIAVVNESKLIPARGVYAVVVLLHDKKYAAMLNIGYRPTFSDEKELSVEVHILDFSSDIYDASVSINFMHRLRDEQKFESLEALKNQLEKDKLTVLKLLA